MVGANVETEGFELETPIPGDVEAGAVIGPSAGLMFALGIYDALTPGQLGGSQAVAGTGTLGSDGRVGPIDGIEAEGDRRRARRLRGVRLPGRERRRRAAGRLSRSR